MVLAANMKQPIGGRQGVAAGRTVQSLGSTGSMRRRDASRKSLDERLLRFNAFREYLCRESLRLGEAFDFHRDRVDCVHEMLNLGRSCLRRRAAQPKSQYALTTADPQRSEDERRHEESAARYKQQDSHGVVFRHESLGTIREKTVSAAPMMLYGAAPTMVAERDAPIRLPLRNHYAIPMWNLANRRTRITSRVFVDTSCTTSAIVMFGSRTQS